MIRDIKCEEYQETIDIMFTYHNCPYYFVVHRAEGWVSALQHDWYEREYSCSLCGHLNGGVCKQMILMQPTLIEVMQKVIHHPTIRMKLVTETSISFDDPCYVFFTGDSGYLSLEEAREKLTEFIERMKKENKKISGLWSALDKISTDEFELSSERQMKRQFMQEDSAFFSKLSGHFETWDGTTYNKQSINDLLVQRDFSVENDYDGIENSPYLEMIPKDIRSSWTLDTLKRQWLIDSLLYQLHHASDEEKKMYTKKMASYEGIVIETRFSTFSDAELDWLECLINRSATDILTYLVEGWNLT